jgi:cytochrome oxidase Cu insertion factor (SCO1/SenC/PrrC family)
MMMMMMMMMTMMMMMMMIIIMLLTTSNNESQKVQKAHRRSAQLALGSGERNVRQAEEHIISLGHL